MPSILKKISPTLIVMSLAGALGACGGGGGDSTAGSNPPSNAPTPPAITPDNAPRITPQNFQEILVGVASTFDNSPGEAIQLFRLNPSSRPCEISGSASYRRFDANNNGMLDVGDGLLLTTNNCMVFGDNPSQRNTIIGSVSFVLADSTCGASTYRFETTDLRYVGSNPSSVQRASQEIVIRNNRVISDVINSQIALALPASSGKEFSASLETQSPFVQGEDGRYESGRLVIRLDSGSLLIEKFGPTIDVFIGRIDADNDGVFETSSRPFGFDNLTDGSEDILF